MTARCSVTAALILCLTALNIEAADVRAYVIARTNGEVAAAPYRVATCISDMNMVYSQVGLAFNLVECAVVTSNELYVVYDMLHDVRGDVNKIDECFMSNSDAPIAATRK